MPLTALASFSLASTLQMQGFILAFEFGLEFLADLCRLLGLFALLLCWLSLEEVTLEYPRIFNYTVM